MRTRARMTIGLLAATVVACGQETPTEPPPRQVQLDGLYAGPVFGHNQGWDLRANLVVEIEQSGSELSGTSELNGVIAGESITDSGLVTGSVSQGPNPSVELTITPTLCPELAETWTGAYDEPTATIFLTGRMEAWHILYGDCIVTSVQFNGLTVALSRRSG